MSLRSSSVSDLSALVDPSEEHFSTTSSALRQNFFRESELRCYNEKEVVLMVASQALLDPNSREVRGCTTIASLLFCHSIQFQSNRVQCTVNSLNPTTNGTSQFLVSGVNCTIMHT